MVGRNDRCEAPESLAPRVPDRDLFFIAVHLRVWQVFQTMWLNGHVSDK
ncbi:MAG: hypothetical protein JWL62_2884 [Hyphomicrobiales bacterium]|nr:hypothetical protein [Hyphomicrobiales bacterium]